MSHKVVCQAAMLIAGLALPLGAQFSHLTATDDGKYLYFTSSLTLKNNGKLVPPQDRLYRLGPEGTAMIAEAETFGPQWRHFSPRVSAPSVSGDGEVVGLTLHGVCDGGAGSCGELMFRGGKNLDLGAGSVHVSRSGKWALLTVDNGGPFATSATLMEIGTGERTGIPVPANAFMGFYPTPFVLASDGSFMGPPPMRGVPPGANQPGVWKAGKFTPFALYQSRSVRPLALSDDGSKLVLVGLGTGQLVARDLASGRDSVLFTLGAQTSPPHFPEIATVLGISNNGQRVLFKVGNDPAEEGRAYFSDVPSGKTQPMPLGEGELVSDGTLSGSGDFAFVVTTAGRLAKVSLSTGAVDTLIPPTPYASNLDWWAFGSLFHMKGTFTGAASDWKGRILIDGRPAPVLAAKAGQLDIQVPWSTSSGSVPFRIVDPGGSPFEQNGMALARSYGIALEPAPPGEPNLFGIKASNGDGTGPPPAQPGPGDTFRLYFTGLGPVENQPETGAPASGTTASPIKAKLICGFLPHTSPVATVSASLVPGAIGLYQATFRMPPNAVPATLIQADCDLCAPCEGDALSPFPFHGKCGDACMVSGWTQRPPGREPELVP
jgi:uncharacterized protein (TIGR03437 family)